MGCWSAVYLSRFKYSLRSTLFPVFLSVVVAKLKVQENHFYYCVGVQRIGDRIMVIIDVNFILEHRKFLCSLRQGPQHAESIWNKEIWFRAPSSLITRELSGKRRAIYDFNICGFFFLSTCKFGDFGLGYSRGNESRYDRESNLRVLITAYYLWLRNQTRSKGKNNGQTSENWERWKWERELEHWISSSACFIRWIVLLSHFTCTFTLLFEYNKGMFLILEIVPLTVDTLSPCSK